MAYTVPSEWKEIDGVHTVAPRSPIVGGDSDNSAFDALIQDHHLVRATRMSCALSMANTDAWTNTSGPGAGVSAWASFGKTKIETQAGFDGTLRVTVWAKDCQSPGGVYIAVFNTGGALQTSLTLTNSAPSVKQVLTGNLSGLSASTQYQIEVRFAAKTSSSPTAELYGVLVEPRALTASTIDDKVDDGLADDDATASSLIPFLIRDNLISSMRERMPHCTHVYPDESKIQMSAPTVSTHPDEWWGIPFWVPVPRGADSVGVRIRYEVATANVKVRLRVIGGAIGTASTLSTTGSVTLSSEITASLRSDGTSRHALVMLSFQSQQGSSIATVTSSITDSGERGFAHTLTVSSGSVAAGSYIKGSDGNTYVGSLSAGTDATVWPARFPGSAQFFTGTVYDLGAITLHSIGIEVKPHASTLNGFLIPSTKSMTVGKPMQFETLQNLASSAWEVYSMAAQWYSCRPTPGTLTSFFGVSSAASAPVAGALLKRRADSVGVEVVVLFITDTRTVRTGSVDVTIQNRTASTTETTTVASAVNTRAFENPHTALAANIGGFSDGYGTTDWASQDLIREEEAEMLSVIERVIPWPSGTSVGDVLEVSVAINENIQHVFGASLREYVQPFEY